jgi:hypothetical protein
MKRFSLAVLCFIVLVLLTSTALVFAESTNIDGKWTMKVVTQKESGNATFILKQSGDLLTGKYSGSLGEAPVTGTIHGRDVQFQFTTDPQKGYAVYTGKVDGKTMKGDVDYGGTARGTFEGKLVE